jgi:hypothetical protein
MSDEENESSAEDPEQSDKQPVDSEQSQESERSEEPAEQSDSRPADETQQSDEQSDAASTEAGGQPAEQSDQPEQSEEQPADSDQPVEQAQATDADQTAEQPEEQSADSDRRTTEQSDDKPADSDQPAEQEQPVDASANNTRSTHLADTRTLPILPAPLSYSAGLFLLSLDGEAAVLKDVDVGTIKSEVVTIRIGMSMGKDLYEWIKASLDKNPQRKNGYVVVADYNYNSKRYLHFRGALITEITIPALDNSSKDTSFFTIKFAPEEITYQAGDDADIKGVANTKQKTWLTSNFRLRLGDLPCGHVSKIDSFTIKQHIQQDAVGSQRISTKEPTGFEIPNLKVTFSASDVNPWVTFFDDFVKGQGAELSGAIEFLDPSLKEVLGSVDLFQVGIRSLAEDKGDANKDSIKRATAELYVERMMLNLAYV